MIFVDRRISRLWNLKLFNQVAQFSGSEYTIIQSIVISNLIKIAWYKFYNPKDVNSAEFADCETEV